MTTDSSIISSRTSSTTPSSCQGTASPPPTPPDPPSSSHKEAKPCLKYATGRQPLCEMTGTPVWAEPVCFLFQAAHEDTGSARSKAFLVHLWLSVAVATVALGGGGRGEEGGSRGQGGNPGGFVGGNLAGCNLGNTNKPRRDVIREFEGLGFGCSV